MKSVTTLVLVFAAMGNAWAARYVGSVVQPHTVPPGSCCFNTGLIGFKGVGSVPDIIQPIDWHWSFDVNFDPTQGITINSMTVSSVSNDYFPHQPHLSFDGLFRFKYPTSLQPLAPTTTRNQFVTGQITPQSLTVNGTWNNFGVETQIYNVITEGVSTSQAFAFDFSNYPQSIGVTCSGALQCNSAGFAAPANVYAVPSITYPPYYTQGQVRSYMSETATLALTPEPISGDYNRDDTVDAADYTVWRDGLDTIYTQDDYDDWKAHFGESAGSASLALNAPEPASFSVLGLAIAALAVVNRRRHRIKAA